MQKGAGDRELREFRELRDFPEFREFPELRELPEPREIPGLPAMTENQTTSLFPWRSREAVPAAAPGLVEMETVRETAAGTGTAAMAAEPEEAITDIITEDGKTAGINGVRKRK